MATVREAKQMAVAATVAEWIRDGGVEVTGRETDTLRVADAAAGLGSWVVFTGHAPQPSGTRAMSRTELVEQIVAAGGRWDQYAKVLRRVRLA